MSDVSSKVYCMELDLHQRARLEQLTVTYGLDLVLLFGSRVTGKCHARSDLDVAVRYTNSFDLEREISLASELAAIFPQEKVDVVAINRADPLLLKQIAQNCQLLMGTKRMLYEFRIYAFRRYQDHKRYLQMEQSYVRRGVKELQATCD